MMADRFVYFDLGNVLVHFDHELAVSQLAALTGSPPSAVRQAVFGSDLQTRFETGLISGSQFTAEINGCFQTDLPTADVMEAISAIFQPNHAILDAMQRVREAGVPMGVLSNTCDAHWLWLQARGWPMLGDWFEQIVLSYEVRGMKPGASIYEASERLAGCSGEAIFFTDDRADNIAAAAQRGWATHQFVSVDNLLLSLDAWLQTATAEVSSTP